MRVFLTGATGYVGSAVAEKLVESGHSVVGLSRSDAGDAKLRAMGVIPHRGDLNDPQSLAQAALTSDGIIHTAFGNNFDDFTGMVGTDLLALTTMLTSLEDKNKPIVVTNGPAFLGDSGDGIFDESAPIDESSYFAVRAKPDLEALQAANRGIRSVVIRLPFYVYGKGGSTFIPVQIGAAQKTGLARYIGEGANRASSVYVEDAATAYVKALENAQAGSLYHLSDGFDASAKQIAEAIGENLNVPAISTTFEIAEETFGTGLANFFSMNSCISADKIKHELGWSPQANHNILEDIARGSYKIGR
ncbi:MAG: SDR family oxidoreductase [Chthonomonadaceae bacterium]|nr:SDR family oxidoreductase [Chthonomonadaceae bacterium]